VARLVDGPAVAQNTTRSAHEAKLGVVVTTTARPHRDTRQDHSITASPLTESKAPDGSSARSSCARPPRTSDSDALSLPHQKLIGKLSGGPRDEPSRATFLGRAFFHRDTVQFGGSGTFFRPRLDGEKLKS